MDRHSKGILRRQMMESAIGLQILLDLACADRGSEQMIIACKTALDEIELRLLAKLEHGLEARGLLEVHEEVTQNGNRDD